MKYKQENQLTIILTLKDRSEFTYRWIQYMNESKCPYLILIADGGSDTKVQEHLQNTENYPFLRYEYIRYPEDSILIDYYKKLQSVVSKVKTEYILFADNDDFICVENIKECIHFLNKDSEYVSCGGRLINLYLYENSALSNRSKGDKYIARYLNVDKTISHQKAEERVKYFFQKADQLGLWNCWYQVHRATSVVDAFKILESIYFQELVVFEIAVHMTLLKVGKYKDIEVNLTYRQEGTSQSSAELDSRGNLLQRWIINNSFNELNEAISRIFPNINADEKITIADGIVEWISARAGTLFPKRPTSKINIRTLCAKLVDMAEIMGCTKTLSFISFLGRKVIYLKNIKLNYFLLK